MKLSDLFGELLYDLPQVTASGLFCSRQEVVELPRLAYFVESDRLPTSRLRFMIGNRHNITSSSLCKPSKGFGSNVLLERAKSPTGRPADMAR